MKVVSRRDAVKSGVALLGVGAVGIATAPQSMTFLHSLNRLAALQDVSVHCTGVAINGGGLGGPLHVYVTFASADGSLQATLIVPSDDGFVDGQHYLMSIVPE